MEDGPHMTQQNEQGDGDASCNGVWDPFLVFWKQLHEKDSFLNSEFMKPFCHKNDKDTSAESGFSGCFYWPNVG